MRRNGARSAAAAAVTLKALAVALCLVLIPASAQAAGPSPTTTTLPATGGTAPDIAPGTTLVPPPAAPTVPPAVAALQKAATKLQQELETARTAIEQLSERLNATVAEERAVAQQITIAEAQRKQAIADLRNAQGQLDARVRSTYITGQGSSLSDLLGLPNASDVFRRLETGVLSADADAIHTALAAKGHLDAVNAALAADLARKQQVEAELAGQRRDLVAQAAALDLKLKEVDQRVAALMLAEQQRQEVARREQFAAYAAALKAQGIAVGAGLEPSAAAKLAVAFALHHLGDRYVWGAGGPDTFDCSGLTSAAYLAAAVTIPRVAADQFAAGQKVALTDLIPGDLVFFATDTTDPTTIHHVGMYVGNGLIVHAPHTGDVVRLASLWREDYAGAVRVIPAEPLVPKNAPTP